MLQQMPYASSKLYIFFNNLYLCTSIFRWYDHMSLKRQMAVVMKKNLNERFCADHKTAQSKTGTWDKLQFKTQTRKLVTGTTFYNWWSQSQRIKRAEPSIKCHNSYQCERSPHFLGIMVKYLNKYSPRLAEFGDSVWEITKTNVHHLYVDLKILRYLMSSRKKVYQCIDTQNIISPASPITLQTDAWLKYVGAVLHEEGQAVHFGSKSLSATSKKLMLQLGISLVQFS